MSYQSKLRKEIDDIRSLIAGEVTPEVKDKIRMYANNAAVYADLAMNASFVDGEKKGNSGATFPEGTLESRITEVVQQGCLVAVGYNQHGIWTVRIDAGGQTRFFGRNQDPAKAFEQAQEEMERFENLRGVLDLRQP